MIELFNPPNVPPPFSRYSQGALARQGLRWLHVSGQVGMRPDGGILSGIEAQLHQTWDNVLGVLAGAGMTADHLVKVDGDRASSHTYGAWRLIRHAAGDPPVWDGTGYYDDQWLRTAEGWRIAKRVCRVVWWTGNPRVQTPMEDIAFQLDLVSPRDEGRGGRLNFLKAIS